MSLRARLPRLFWKHARAQPQPVRAWSSPSPPSEALTIVTPSYEGHAVQFGRFVESIDAFCTDPERLVLRVIVEEQNVALFREIVADRRVAVEIATTEDALIAFGVSATPAAFLKRAGKFTFQTLKKFHGLRTAATAWSLVLDSETLIVAPFSAATLLQDYAARRYVFYSRTAPRGNDWDDALGKDVTKRCAAAIGGVAPDRWYMEFFHWFYEAAKVSELIEQGLTSRFWTDIRDESCGEVNYFEPVLYYQFLEKNYADEYEFIDISDALRRTLPPPIAARFVPSELPFSRFGNEYLLNLLAPDEVHHLAPLFERYRLPFLRLEPPMIRLGYDEAVRQLPHFAAFISSQHLTWLRKPMAVCISGSFSGDRWITHNQVRQIVGFLSGVECDVYVCCNDNADQAAVVTGLRPTRHAFIEPPAAAAPMLDGPFGRNVGSDWDFAAAEQCFALIGDTSRYGYVMHFVPGLAWDVSLKEIMISISDNSDVLANAIYVPRAMHGPGLNTRMALGSVAAMTAYFGYRGRDEAPGGGHAHPQVGLLHHILASGVEVVFAEMAYSHLDETSPRINSTFEQFSRQFGSDWGVNEQAKLFSGMTAVLRKKLPA